MTNIPTTLNQNLKLTQIDKLINKTINFGLGKNLQQDVSNSTYNSSNEDSFFLVNQLKVL